MAFLGFPLPQNLTLSELTYRNYKGYLIDYGIKFSATENNAVKTKSLATENNRLCLECKMNQTDFAA